MNSKPLDALVVGAGPSGLAAAHALRQAGLTFRVLEAGPDAGGSWPGYYRSLRLFSSRRYSALPGLAFPGRPTGLPVRDEVTSYLRAYARHFDFPVETHARVARVERWGHGFEIVATDARAWHACAVIAATGACTAPFRPAFTGMDRFRGQVLHSAEYRTPEPFAGKRVVVVGAGNSAVQIAVELDPHARVTLATRGPVRFLPRRILGRDIQFWTRWTGLERCHWLNAGNHPVIDAGGYAEALRQGRPEQRAVFTRFTESGVVWPDAGEERVDTVLLATGYRESFPFLEPLPGAEQHRRGVSAVGGVYFVGRPGQNGIASATLRGAGRDARHVVRHLRRRLRSCGITAATASDRAPRVRDITRSGTGLVS